MDNHKKSNASFYRQEQNFGRPKTLIFLSVDCFKHFCMLAKTAKGKEIRDYYIYVRGFF